MGLVISRIQSDAHRVILSLSKYVRQVVEPRLAPEWILGEAVKVWTVLFRGVHGHVDLPRS